MSYKPQKLLLMLSVSYAILSLKLKLVAGGPTAIGSSGAGSSPT